MLKPLSIVSFLSSITAISCALLCFASSVVAQPKVGVILPLSGPFAIIGEDCQRGVESAKQQTSIGSLIKLIYADNKGEAKYGVTEFQRLARQERVDAVITTRSPIAMSINPLSKQLKIPLMASVAIDSLTVDNPFAFRFWPSTTQEGQYLAQKLRNDGIHRLAIITGEDDWLVQNSSALRASYASTDDPPALSSHASESFKIVMDELVTTSEQNLLPLILKLKAAKPDAVYLNLGISQLPNVLKRIKDLQLQLKIISNFWISKIDKTDLDGGIAEGTSFLEPFYQFKGSERIFSAHFPDRPPSFLAIACYSSAHLLFEGISRALRTDSELTPETLLAALQTVSSIPIGDEKIAVQERRAHYKLAMFKIKNGQKELLAD